MYACVVAGEVTGEAMRMWTRQSDDALRHCRVTAIRWRLTELTVAECDLLAGGYLNCIPV